MSNYLPTDYQSFIHTSRYARWLEDEGRRESWDETVNRYMDNVVEPAVNSGISEDNFNVAHDIEQAILGLDASHDDCRSSCYS